MYARSAFTILLTASRCGVKLEIIWEITKQILGTPDELILSCSPVSPRGLRSTLAIQCMISAYLILLKETHLESGHKKYLKLMTIYLTI